MLCCNESVRGSAQIVHIYSGVSAYVCTYTIMHAQKQATCMHACTRAHTHTHQCKHARTYACNCVLTYLRNYLISNLLTGTLLNGLAPWLASQLQRRWRGKLLWKRNGRLFYIIHTVIGHVLVVFRQLVVSNKVTFSPLTLMSK